jgi:AcrR family transcriptional regulator
MVTKGDRTRQAILEEAMAQATRLGIEGLSIGQLAKDAGLSKSGLYAHFQSKEELQIQVLELATQRFVDMVVRPAMLEPRGEPRLRSMFERWLEWAKATFQPGGCIFLAAAIELDDRPGPVRDWLVADQHKLLAGIRRHATAAVDAGQFRSDLNTAQFSFQYFSIYLGYHHFQRLLTAPEAEQWARQALDNLCQSARPIGAT